MFQGGKNMQDLMKKAKQMQQAMESQQKALEEKEFEASSGGGMVTVKMSGSGQLLSLKIDPEAVDPDDVEMLEDLIMAAIGEVQSKVNEASSEMMQGLTGGMKIPGLF
ncbi:MAG TPA: YbaB/EbfC family nucleoid-associated protein [Candidatus Cloacimonadota bacterium]|nr:YbaB/EbfC family nucleoid-associated protein [Candidatus Cloacimonadota bacterium]